MTESSDGNATATPGVETPPAAPARKKPPRTEEPESIGSILSTVGSALLLAIAIRILVFELFEIDGPSMQRTLLHEDRVFVHKFPYGLWLPGMTHAVLNWGSPNLGDVIILNSPADDNDLVKRVVGLPGDLIEVEDGVVYRNGSAVPSVDRGPCRESEQKIVHPDCRIHEERLGGHVYQTTRADFGPDTLEPVRVPPGHVFVMGDHRDQSNDSRALNVGPIPMNRVKGKVAFIVTSGSILRGEARWSRFFQGVP